VEEGVDYLLMTRVTGKMSCDEEYMKNPRLLTRLLAKALQMLWKIDISACPIQWALKEKLEAAKKCVEQGLVDVENTEPGTFGEQGFRDPQELLDWLCAHQPAEELVLSHGDFCLPNIFLEGEHVAGFIDLGRTGVADRWQDIALCYRSLKHNFEGKYNGISYEGFDSGMLFEELGIEPDWEKLNYYILMDELF
jgi:kanamycin kinase/aminoglycoside 3'-phosphotransferase-3